MVSDIRLREAFAHVKNDVTVLKAEIARLSKENDMLIKIVKKQTDALVSKKTKTEKKVVVKKAAVKTEFVASKNGGKFHRKTCPYAKNIKPKDQVKFGTKNSALNKGYKACKCI